MNRHWKTVMAWLGGLVGLSSCEALNIGRGEEMYGCPYADYDLNILITDEDGVPLNGIAVITPESEYKGQYLTTSDKDGKAVASFNGTGCMFMLRDIDGEANGGEFEDMGVEGWKDLSLTKTRNGKDWYQGRFDATGSVKMTRKKSAE